MYRLIDRSSNDVLFDSEMDDVPILYKIDDSVGMYIYRDDEYDSIQRYMSIMYDRLMHDDSSVQSDLLYVPIPRCKYDENDTKLYNCSICNIKVYDINHFTSMDHTDNMMMYDEYGIIHDMIDDDSMMINDHISSKVDDTPEFGSKYISYDTSHVEDASSSICEEGDDNILILNVYHIDISYMCDAYSSVYQSYMNMLNNIV